MLFRKSALEQQKTTVARYPGLLASGGFWAAIRQAQPA
jgi:hypothetical protein